MTNHFALWEKEIVAGCKDCIRNRAGKRMTFVERVEKVETNAGLALALAMMAMYIAWMAWDSARGLRNGNG